MALHSPTLGRFLLRKEIIWSGEMDLDQHLGEYALIRLQRGSQDEVAYAARSR